VSIYIAHTQKSLMRLVHFVVSISQKKLTFESFKTQLWVTKTVRQRTPRIETVLIDSNFCNFYDKQGRWKCRTGKCKTTLCPKKTSPTFSTVTWRGIIGF